MQKSDDKKNNGKLADQTQAGRRLFNQLLDIGGSSMRLRTKFIVFIGLVVIISYGITFYRTSAFQQELMITQTAQQARMLYKQILLTRKWVADHNGIFLLKQPGADINPYLAEPEIADITGRKYVKRNPAMVTRELSEYADIAGFCRYRVTSLKPFNPANAPDDFERHSLELFEKGAPPEAMTIEKNQDGRVLRYIAPLIVESSCLECHSDQGYKTGDVRGGLSVTIPMDWAYEGISKNNRLLFMIAVITIVVVGIAIFFLLDLLVVRRLDRLARAMTRFPNDPAWDSDLPAGSDEVGRLSRKFRDLCHRLTTSQEELDRTRQQVFQSEKMAALGRLTAGIAHEINNPLGGMLNCLKNLDQNPDDREMQRRYLGLLFKGLNRIGQTVRQLLNFGRQEPLVLRKVQIDDLVRECLVLLEYGMKNIELQLDLRAACSVIVDVEALKQVIVNIGLNAIQAMEGGGTMTVVTRCNHDRIILECSDTGPGIAPEYLDKIFDPFFTTKEVGKGTGLGLSITYSLVQRLHGEIMVQSELGKGAIFRIILPTGSPKQEDSNNGRQ